MVVETLQTAGLREVAFADLTEDDAPSTHRSDEVHNETSRPVHSGWRQTRLRKSVQSQLEKIQLDWEGVQETRAHQPLSDIQGRREKLCAKMAQNSWYRKKPRALLCPSTSNAGGMKPSPVRVVTGGSPDSVLMCKHGCQGKMPSQTGLTERAPQISFRGRKSRGYASRSVAGVVSQTQTICAV